MTVVKTGAMPDGTKVQIEDWSENYDFIPPSSTIAAYAVSKWTIGRPFGPRAGEINRFQFDFADKTETENAFAELISGEKSLADFKGKLNRPEYATCL